MYHVTECPRKVLTTWYPNVGNTNQNIVCMDAFGKYGFYTLFEPKKSRVLFFFTSFFKSLKSLKGCVTFP
jgi:hypothetical protein